MKTLAKIQQDKWIGGVCSGFAYALGVPTWIVRIATVLIALSTGLGFLAYILLWIFMPVWHMEPQDYLQRTSQDQGGPGAGPAGPANPAPPVTRLDKAPDETTN